MEKEISLSKQYLEVLLELDEILKNFSKMEEKTAQLKERYKSDPRDEKLLKEIKTTEENYRLVLERVTYLNNKARKLKRHEV